MEKKRFITAKELMAEYGITKGQLYNLTFNHLIPFYKPTPNGRLLFKREDIEKWIEERKCTAVDMPC